MPIKQVYECDLCGDATIVQDESTNIFIVFEYEHKNPDTASVICPTCLNKASRARDAKANEGE